jgi:DNA-binding Xre family transcriptional regulator
MNKSKNNIDTGKLLTAFLDRNRINKAELGRNINRTGVSVLKYTNNSSIQTGILIDLCYALKHNFFQDIVNLLPADFTKNELVDVQKNLLSEKQIALIAKLEEENKILKIQNELLRQVVGKL